MVASSAGRIGAARPLAKGSPRTPTDCDTTIDAATIERVKSLVIDVGMRGRGA
jgi:hypothetical protein